MRLEMILSLIFLTLARKEKVLNIYIILPSLHG